MEAATAGELLREVRKRHDLGQEALAIRAGLTQIAVADIESGTTSPSIETLNELLQLLGEDLVLASEKRITGIDLTLDQGNLELSPEQRVLKRHGVRRSRSL